MKRWAAAIGALFLGMGISGAVLATAAPASTHAQMRCDHDADRDDVGCPRTGALVLHRCDGDRDRDDIGCPATAPRVVVVQPRLTG